jgi:hypothetical protein
MSRSSEHTQQRHGLAYQHRGMSTAAALLLVRQRKSTAGQQLQKHSSAAFDFLK